MQLYKHLNLFFFNWSSRARLRKLNIIELLEFFITSNGVHDMHNKHKNLEVLITIRMNSQSVWYELNPPSWSHYVYVHFIAFKYRHIPVVIVSYRHSIMLKSIIICVHLSLFICFSQRKGNAFVSFYQSYNFCWQNF